MELHEKEAVLGVFRHLTLFRAKLTACWTECPQPTFCLARLICDAMENDGEGQAVVYVTCLTCTVMAGGGEKGPRTDYVLSVVNLSLMEVITRPYCHEVCSAALVDSIRTSQFAMMKQYRETPNRLSHVLGP